MQRAIGLKRVHSSVVLAAAHVFVSARKSECGVWDPGAGPLVGKAVDDARTFEEVVAAARRKEIHSVYRASLTNSGKAATKRAFLATQLAEEVFPTVVDAPSSRGPDTMSADPLHVLLAERNALDTIWHEAGCDADFGSGPAWGGGDPLPRHTPEDLRSASRVFQLRRHGQTMAFIQGTLRC